MTPEAFAEVIPQPLEVAGRVIPTDHLGYLLDPADWDAAVAAAIAEREGLTLGGEHLAVIGLVREHYERCQAVPEARTLLKGMCAVLGETRATRRYLHDLFPSGYGSQVCKIAGMAMPREVMLDV
jgi:TusE/DsrC/DsvC family sulfur relay protein